MFVSHECLRRNPKTKFYDKSFPMGSIPERHVSLFLEHSCNPKGKLAYKYFFDMHEKKEFVIPTTMVAVTPAQEQLLTLLAHHEAKDHHESLKLIHHLATYCTDKDNLELWRHGYVHELMDAIQSIAQENTINNLKTA